MKRNLIMAGALLAFLTGCTEPNAPTASRDQRVVAFDAAAALTSIVADPVGDVKNKAAVWQDVVVSEIARAGNTFVFTMDVADVVPSSPPEASGGLGILVWIWGIFPPGESGPVEFFIDVEWDGTQFTGNLYDLRPLLTGGDLVITPVPFTIEGAEVSVFVEASALGDPSAFDWHSGTLIRHSHLGSEGFQEFDRAPDAGNATWPQ